MFENLLPHKNDKSTGLMVQDVETLEAEEVKNQFSFEVVEKPIYMANNVLIDGYKSLSRSDNGNILNVCKDSYTPVTNESFCAFVERVQNLTGFESHGFNEFDDGKKVLAFLKAPETVLNGWQFSNFMVIGNAHDGTKAAFIANTSIMYRCQNQFSMFSGQGLKAFHSAGIEGNLKAIENSIHLYSEQQKALEANYEKMLQSSVDQNRSEMFVKHILDITETDFSDQKSFEKLSTQKLNQLDALTGCIETEFNDLGVNDFALFNGVTRYTTHKRKQNKKSFGNLFGTNAILNNKALNFLLN